MPGNTILINNSFEYYIGDSKMEKLFQFLDDIGHRKRLMAGNVWPDFKKDNETSADKSCHSHDAATNVYSDDRSNISGGI